MCIKRTKDRGRLKTRWLDVIESKGWYNSNKNVGDRIKWNLRTGVANSK